MYRINERFACFYRHKLGYDVRSSVTIGRMRLRRLFSLDRRVSNRLVEFDDFYSSVTVSEDRNVCDRSDLFYSFSFFYDNMKMSEKKKSTINQ